MSEPTTLAVCVNQLVKYVILGQRGGAFKLGEAYEILKLINYFGSKVTLPEADMIGPEFEENVNKFGPALELVQAKGLLEFKDVDQVFVTFKKIEDILTSHKNPDGPSGPEESDAEKLKELNLGPSPSPTSVKSAK